MRHRHAVPFLILALVVLGASPGVADEQKPAELVLWNLPNRPVVHAPGAAAAEKLDLFLAEHPDIAIRRGGGPQLQRFGRGTREFLMAQAGGIAPDVVVMSAVDLQDFMDRNFILPLDDYLRDAGVLDEVRQSPFARQTQRDGHIYALPVGTKKLSFVLVYRKDWFEQMGLDPDKPPRTWEEFLRVAELLSDPPNNRTGFVLPSLETKGPLGAGAFVETVFALNGVEVIRKTDDGQWVADFADDERAVAALSFIKELIGRRIERDGKEYRGIACTSAGRVDDSIMFATSEAGMVIQTMTDVCWHQNRGTSIRDIGIAPLPLGPSGDGFTPMRPSNGLGGAEYVGVNATCPTEARRSAAWEYVKFQQDGRLNRINASAYIDWGWAPYIDPSDVAGDPELDGFIEMVPPQWAQVWKTQLENARALPMCPQQRQLRQDYLARPFWALLKNPDADVRALLAETQEAINRELFGEVPKDVHQRRQRIALAVVVIIAAVIVVVVGLSFRGVAKTLAADRTKGTVFQAGRRRVYFLAMLFMIPAVGSVILWQYLPLFRGAFIAFQQYEIVGQTTWVGLDNFIDVLTDNKFWISLLRTLQYGAISLSLGFVAPIVLAFFLSEVPRGKVLFRVLFYLPALTSGLVVMFLWKWMYDPTPRGLLNVLMAQLGNVFGQEWGPFKWLDSESLAMISVILPTIWAGIGPGSIIYLAALHGVPEDLYEAADLDGAGPWSKLWNISIPFLKPLIIINFLGAFIATFHTMQNIFVMTQGGPGDATYVVGLYIFFNSFVWLNFGKATAAAWLLGSLLIGFTVYQLRIIRRLRFQAGSSTEE